MRVAVRPMSHNTVAADPNDFFRADPHVEEDMHALQLGPESSAGPQFDRRRSHREQVVALGKLHSLDASDRGHSIQVLVTNLSLHGCGVRCAQAPRPGALYQLDLQIGPLELHSRLRIIRAFGRADGTTELGCEFI